MYSHQMIARAYKKNTYTYLLPQQTRPIWCSFSLVHSNQFNNYFRWKHFFSLYSVEDRFIIKIAGAQRHIMYKSIEWCRYMLKTLCVLFQNYWCACLQQQWIHTFICFDSSMLWIVFSSFSQPNVRFFLLHFLIARCDCWHGIEHCSEAGTHTTHKHSHTYK